MEVRIAGVICRLLEVYEDQRGWLAEIFRQDEVAPEHLPVMAYLSVTKPGVGRGPHAHRDQTDMFCFAGPGDFRVMLWDNRADSPTFGTRQDFHLGAFSSRRRYGSLPTGRTRCWRPGRPWERSSMAWRRITRS